MKPSLSTANILEKNMASWMAPDTIQPGPVSGGPVDGACVFKRRMMEMANEEETSQ